MLFDLQGKRKNVIRVIYAFLALLLGGGLVLLGIGGDASGGLLNAVGLGSDGTTDADPALERQIDSANDRLAENPEDAAALLILARTQYLIGNNALETDEEGQPIFTEEALEGYEAGGDAWQRYLETKPEKVDDGVASLMVRLYESLAFSESSPSLLEQHIANAYEAAQIVAEARPSLGTNVTLAQWAYLSADTKAGDQARKAALAEAADSTTKQQVNQQLDAYESQGKQVEKQLAKSAADPEELKDPLSGLGGTTPALPGG